MCEGGIHTTDDQSIDFRRDLCAPADRAVDGRHCLDHLDLLSGALAGLKIGWAFAWRTLIAAELVFGVSAGSGGLGWFIYQNKNQLEIPSVFAGLFMVIFIGLVVENLIFKVAERLTVRKWGMQA